MDPLPPCDEAAASQPSSQGPPRPVRVETQIVVQDIGAIDLVAATVEIKMEISSNWKDATITSEAQAEEGNVWRPKLNVFNRTRDMSTYEQPTIFFQNGVCGLDVTVEGPVPVAIGQSLKDFPFDELCLEVIIDGCDHYMHERVMDLRIVPNESIHSECFGSDPAGDKALKFNPGFDPLDACREWLLMGVMLQERTTKWSRVYRRMHLILKFARKPFYYAYKVVIVLLILMLLVVTAFAIPPTDVADRLSYIATLFLATTAFLYANNAYLPRTAYLNHLDRLIIATFAVQFMCALVSAVEGVALRLNANWLSYTTFTDILCTFLCTVVLVCLVKFWLPSYVLAWRKMSRKQEGNGHLEVACPKKQPYGAKAKSKGYLEEAPKDEA